MDAVKSKPKMVYYKTMRIGLVMTFRPARKEIIDGIVIPRAGEYIHFRDGEYGTDDPLKQQFIEAKKDYGVTIFRLEKSDDEVMKDVEKQKKLEKVTQLQARHMACPNCGKNFTSKNTYEVHIAHCEMKKETEETPEDGGIV